MMIISLRKANALQLAINEALKNLEFKSNVVINEFQDPVKEIENGSIQFSKNLVRRNSLLTSLYEIRKATNIANNATIIDSLLADLARLEKDLVFFSTYAKAAPQTDLNIINGKLDKIKNRSDDNYYAKSEVETSVLTASAIESFAGIVAAVKKQKQKLQDELLELNVRTTIELTETTVTTLTEEGIV